MRSENTDTSVAVLNNSEDLAFPRETLTFDEWMRTLNELALARYGLSTDDLPRANHEGHYRRGSSPLDYLTGAIRQLLETERHDLDLDSL